MDLNRAGAGLMEIVSHPDMRSVLWSAPASVRLLDILLHIEPQKMLATMYGLFVAFYGLSVPAMATWTR